MNSVLVGDCFKVLPSLEEDSVDLCVTSPPYWGLRDYGMEGQLGLEDHPQKFIDRMVEFGRLVRRVLKPSGLFWLNLGDTYCTGAGKSISPGGDIDRGIDKIQPQSSPNRMVPLNGAWLQPKQLLMIPSRVACALQDDGWILRSECDMAQAKPHARVRH